jgi:hypothetical protein
VTCNDPQRSGVFHLSGPDGGEDALMRDSGQARGGRSRAAAGVAALLALAACSGGECSFDRCPEVTPDRAGTVTGTDASGRVRWTTTIADLVVASPFVSNVHVVLEGCHAPHVLDVTTGSVSTPSGLERVLGVVQGYAVGIPTEGDAIVSADRLDGTRGGLSWSQSPQDSEADRGYRMSAVVTERGVVGVHDRRLVGWSRSSGVWAMAEVELPVGAWRGRQLVAADADHVVVPGSDGSVLGVDLGSRAVAWRSLPTRPALPDDLEVRLDARAVTVTAWYRESRAASTIGTPVWTSERWSLDARTGEPTTPRSTARGTHQNPRAQVAASVHDDATGWTVTQQLDEPPKGSCG